MSFEDTANPPYGRRESGGFVRHSLDLLPVGGTARFLLRYDWFATQTRRHLLPHVAEIISAGRVYRMRPANTADKGKTPTVSHAWFTLTKAPENKAARLAFIPMESDK